MSDDTTGGPSPQPQPATPASTAAPAPSQRARSVGLLILGLAVIASFVFGFVVDREPLKLVAESFVVFAGLYAGAQAVERLMEVAVSPFLGSSTDQERADKALLVGAAASLAGVIFSGFIGLYFLHAISGGTFGDGNDDNLARTFDVLLTGLAIGGGTKPLHDLIKRVEKSKENAEAAVKKTKAGLTD